jgi:hypothetical protein
MDSRLEKIMSSTAFLIIAGLSTTYVGYDILRDPNPFITPWVEKTAGIVVLLSGFNYFYLLILKFKKNEK